MPDRRCSRRRRKGSSARRPDASATATRMLENAPKGREALDQFFEEWLRFDRVVQRGEVQTGIRRSRQN